MGYIYTGIERSLTISITKKVGGNIVQGYPKTYDGKAAGSTWGNPTYSAITNTELAQLDDADFNQRLADFIAYVEVVESGVDFDTDIVGDGATRSQPNCTSTTAAPTTSTTTAATTTTTQAVFSAFFVGVTEAGQPYLIASDGSTQQPGSWGGISTTLYASSLVMDYDATNKMLYVAGAGGLLNIYDLRYPDAIQSKTIRVLPSGVISGISVVGNYVLIGKERSGETNSYVYVLDLETSLSSYQNNTARQSQTNSKGNFTNFLLYNGVYWGATTGGEISNCTNPDNNWGEKADWDARFTRMFETDDKLVVLEDNDRPFYCYKTNTNAWYDFDIKASNEPQLLDGCAVANNEFLVITQESSEMVRRVKSNIGDRGTDITPNWSFLRAGGCCYDSTTKKYYVAGTASSGTEHWLFWQTAAEGIWDRMTVPDLFTRLFIY